MSSAARAARTAKERTLLYDVILTAHGPMKIQCVKVLSQVVPGFGLKEGLDLAQSEMPATVVANVQHRVARIVRDRLLAVQAQVSLRCTTSTRAKLKRVAPLIVKHAAPAQQLSGGLSKHSMACEVNIRSSNSHLECDCICHRLTTKERKRRGLWTFIV